MSTLAVKQEVAEALDALSEAELQQVAEYVAFLRFRGRVSPQRVVDTEKLAVLYSEFGVEDRTLAEEGLEEYRDRLLLEDAH